MAPKNLTLRSIPLPGIPLMLRQRPEALSRSAQRKRLYRRRLRARQMRQAYADLVLSELPKPK